MNDSETQSNGWGQSQIIVVAVLGLLVLALGILQGIRLFQPDYQAQASYLKKEKDTLKAELQQTRQLNARLLEQVGEELEVGFEVQIGAFEHYDILAADAELMRMARIEEDGLKKYVLGRFSYFEDAEAFLEDVRAMGLQDAFIAGVVDGKRATVEEAKKAARTYYGF
jgi:hypothetical protein